MPVTFIIAIIVIPLAIAALLARFATSDTDARRVSSLATGVLTVIALILLIADVVTVVPTKTVGVVTSFGRPVGTLSNGLHLVAPWQKVTKFDGSIQTDSHVGRDQCTTVRIANQSTACADNSIRWRIKPSAADDLYRDYKDFETVRDSLVTRQLTASLNDAFASYDPLASVDPETGGSALNKVADKVAKDMRSKIGGQVEILNVVVPLIRYDDSTQDKINQYQAELANTRIAEQKEKTAAAEARANRILASSVSKDPNVLVSKCLDLVAQAIKSGKQLPAGFTCWPGGGKSVVVPSK